MSGDDRPLIGTIALVGSEAFTPELESVDRELLRATGRKRPRVVVLAVGRNVGDREADRLAALGREHLIALGAEVEPVVLRDRSDADDPANAQAVGEADLVYLVGRRARAICGTVDGSAVGAALRAVHRGGGIVCGSAAAATALGSHALGPRLRLGWPFRPRAGLGLLPRLAVLPRYDARPEVLRLISILPAPRETVIVGIDEGTALLGDGRAWQVQGSGRVTLWKGRRRSRHRDGDVLRLDSEGPAAERAPRSRTWPRFPSTVATLWRRGRPGRSVSADEAAPSFPDDVADPQALATDSQLEAADSFGARVDSDVPADAEVETADSVGTSADPGADRATAREREQAASLRRG